MIEEPSTTGQNSLFFVSIFRVDSPGLVEPVRGSCGFLWWHAEIVHYSQDGQKVCFLVIYQSSRGMVNSMWERLGAMESSATGIANSLLLPLSFHVQEHIGIKLFATAVYDSEGKDQGGNFPLMYGRKMGPNSTITGHDYPLLNESPQLKRALQYYDMGLYLTELTLYADACMNYVRAVEALMGKYAKNLEEAYRQECARVGIDFDDITLLMAKIRNKWAIVHVSGTSDKKRKLKEMPDAKTERQCREICRKVIIYYWEQNKRNYEQKERAYWPLYSGFGFGTQVRFVPTLWADHDLGFGSSNLPNPEAVIQRFLQRGTEQSNAANL